MAERVCQWAESRGLALYAPAGHRSKTVTTVKNTRQIDIPALNKFLLQRDMRLANGYGPLKGKTFRIAHMGETGMPEVEGLLAALDEYLDQS
jgi:aspartate aminotransferase-like enzyme